MEILPDPVRRRFNTWRYRNFQRNRLSGRSSIAAFDYYKCIYVHIPKTGGISVNDALWGNPGGVHKNMEDYAKIFGRKTLDEYFTFTIVRNPWARLVSAWVFMKAGGQHARDARWAEKHLAGIDDFQIFVQEWVNESNIRKGIHFIPQVDFLKLDGRISVDFIGKLENIRQDFETVKQRIGLPYAQLPHKNKSAHKDFRDYYTAETRDLVAAVYREDIEQLGYSFDD